MYVQMYVYACHHFTIRFFLLLFGRRTTQSLRTQGIASDCLPDQVVGSASGEQSTCLWPGLGLHT